MFTLTTSGFEELLDTAIRENAKETVAFLMNFLISEYIEGQNEEAGQMYNKYLTQVSQEMIYWIVNTCVFESYANKLAKAHHLLEPYKQVEKYHWQYTGSARN